MRYRDYRPLAQTGDILLLSAKGPLSAAIRHFTRSEWSHCALVIVEPREGIPDQVLCWESTTSSSLRDLDTGRYVRGVQISPLSLRLATFKGRAAVRRLREPASQRELQLLTQIRHELQGRPYESDICELLLAAYDGPWGLNEPDLSSLFCSELLAEVFQRWGRLEKDLPANEYTPADFACLHVPPSSHGPIEPLIWEGFNGR